MFSIFKKVLLGGFKYNTIAQTIAEMFRSMDIYERYHDVQELHNVAHLYHDKIILILNEYGFNLMAPITITIYGHSERMSLNEALSRTLSRFLSLVKKLPEEEQDVIMKLLK